MSTIHNSILYDLGKKTGSNLDLLVRAKDYIFLGIGKVLQEDRYCLQQDVLVLLDYKYQHTMMQLYLSPFIHL